MVRLLIELRPMDNSLILFFNHKLVIKILKYREKHSKNTSLIHQKVAFHDVLATQTEDRTVFWQLLKEFKGMV